MSNLFSVIINSFWIVGLAILLAAFSYQYGQAQQTEPSTLKQRLNHPSFLQFFWLGLIFTGIGLIGTSQHIWEMIIWSLLTILSLINTLKNKSSAKREKGSVNNGN